MGNALRNLFLAGLAAYSVVCINHIGAGWCLRKEFRMAVRSPKLVTLSGIVGVVIPFTNCYRFMLNGLRFGPWELFIIPLGLILNTVVYIMRGLRLLILYNPDLRHRWGPYIKESFMLKTVVVCFAVIQAILRSLALMFGVPSIASHMPAAINFNAFLTLAASVALIRSLRRTKDLFDMSLEIQRVGVCGLSTFVFTALLYAMPSARRNLTVGSVVARYHGTLWFSNIQPVRAILRSGNNSDNAKLGIFLWQHWRATKTAVVGEATSKVPNSLTTTTDRDDPIASILQFPPLLDAFDEFCRKALCIESLMFLVAASNFDDALHTSRAEDTAPFKQLEGIVEKYVVEGAPFEINIDSQTKSRILRLASAASFHKLSMEEELQILRPASREVSKMLKENLYCKFQATDDYKQIMQQLFDTESARRKKGEAKDSP